MARIITAIMMLFVFIVILTSLLFRAMEIEGQYYWKWDEEQQVYFKAERGV